MLIQYCHLLSEQLNEYYIVDVRPLCTLMPRDYIIPFTLHSSQQKCAGTTPRTLQSLVENSSHLEAVPNACESSQIQDTQREQVALFLSSDQSRENEII